MRNGRGRSAPALPRQWPQPQALNRSGHRRIWQLLVALHPGGIGITERRDAVRLQRKGAFNRRDHLVRRLMRKAVHQIEIDTCNADLAEPRHRPPRILERLDSVDGLLDLGVEILDAEACARHADGDERGNMIAVKAARTDLDRDLGALAHLEPQPNHGQPEQIPRRQDRRRPPAPMDMNDLAVSRGARPPRQSQCSSSAT